MTNPTRIAKAKAMKQLTNSLRTDKPYRYNNIEDEFRFALAQISEALAVLLEEPV